MRCKEDDGAAAEAASLAAEHGSTSLTPQRDGARSRSSDFFNGLLAPLTSVPRIRRALRVDPAPPSSRLLLLVPALTRRDRRLERPHVVGDLVRLHVLVSHVDLGARDLHAVAAAFERV